MGSSTKVIRHSLPDSKNIPPSINTHSVIKLESLEQLFLNIQKTFPDNQHSLLNKHKTTIIELALSNVGLEVKKSYTQSELLKIQKELNKIIYTCGNSLDKLIDSDVFEKDVLDEKGAIQDYAPVARNLLRYITRGTLVSGAENTPYAKSLALIQHALEEEKDPHLLSELRTELKAIIAMATEQLINPNKKISPHDEKLYEIFQTNLLAAYPFLDPVHNEVITLPQKIKDEKSGEENYVEVQYRIEKIDISPQTGLLSYLLEDCDRIYAYGMVPIDHPHAKCHLSLMGTTYATGQGADLAVLYNFYPKHSVGEAHDTTHLDNWINSQNRKINVVGHSKGATMSMITAARHPTKIARADALNPTGLCNATLDRLNTSWLKLKENQRPMINVYAQHSDPVFPLENGFLKGTQLFRILAESDACSTLKSFIPSFVQKATDAHLQHIAGRASALVIRMNAEKENQSYRREWFSNIKGALNWTLFPILYTSLVTKLCARKVNRWYEQTIPSQLKVVVSLLIFIPKAIINIALSISKILIVLSASITAGLLTGIFIGFKKLLGIPNLQETYSTEKTQRVVDSTLIGTAPNIVSFARTPTSRPQITDKYHTKAIFKPTQRLTTPITPELAPNSTLMKCQK